MADITGTDAGEPLLGTNGNDTIIGLGGSDTVSPLLGNDTLDGGPGDINNVLSYLTNPFAITLSVSNHGGQVTGQGGGHTKSDTFANFNTFTGTQFDDVFTSSGQASTDGYAFDGRQGRDTIRGNSTFDEARYNENLATRGIVADLNAGFVDDTFGFRDTVSGIERLRASCANDTIRGSDTTPLEYFNANAGDDFVDGRGGIDVMDHEREFVDEDVNGNLPTHGIIVNVALGQTIDSYGDTDTFLNIERWFGTKMADEFNGSNGTELFRGNAGNDIFRLGDGTGVVAAGGEDNDTFFTGIGTYSILDGEEGDDTFRLGNGGHINVIGGEGNDTFWAGTGGASLEGETGDDVYHIQNIANRVREAVGGGTDTVFTSANLAALYAEIENGALEGNVATILGGNELGNILTGSVRNDTLTGFAGNDTIDGGAGGDTAIYTEKTVGVTVDLDRANLVNVLVNGVLEDRLRNVENLLGGSGGDRLTGDAAANLFRGGGGADQLDGDAGSDTADYTDKTQGVEVALNGDIAATVKVNGVAEDTVRNIEILLGGAGNDTFSGDAAVNRLNGNAGDDLLQGGLGNDTLDGGDGVDTVDFRDKTQAVLLRLNGAANVLASVNGVAEDTLSKIENILGGSAADTLTGDGFGNIIRGGGGRDLLDGGAGVDTVDFSDKTQAVVLALHGTAATTAKVGGVDEDSVQLFENIIGGSANDALTGNGLANGLAGGGGNDLLLGGLGIDLLDGGAGSDTADFRDKAAALSVVLKGALVATMTVGGLAEDNLLAVENVLGGSAADTLTGDEFANALAGNGGDDLIRGGAANDTLDGGIGVDTVDFRDKTVAVTLTLAGAATARAKVNGVDEDFVKNFENVFGGSAADNLTGDGLANVLRGGGGNDILDGRGGVDTADYSDKGSVTLVLNGSLLADVLIGGGAVEDKVRYIENIIGGSLRDVLTGDNFNNFFSTGSGDDLIRPSGGLDVYDGGVGVDEVDYQTYTRAISATLNGAANGLVTVSGLAKDTLRNIEDLTGSAFDDSLTGDANANTLDGYAGNDLLRGNGGIDVLDGSSGSDTADFRDKAGSVAVTLNGATAVTVMVGGVSDDRIVRIENVFGGSGDDALTGDGLDNLFRGGGGVDMLAGAAGLDTADYADKASAVRVTLNGAAVVDVEVGGANEDRIGGIENVFGGSADDALTGDGLANVLRGGGGSDTLDGAGGVDTVDFGDKTVAVVLTLNGINFATATVNGIADDRVVNIENIVGGSAADRLTGDAQVNILLGMLGDDTLQGGLGVDTLDGGDGRDTVDYSDKAGKLLVDLVGANNAQVKLNGVFEDTIRRIENVIGGSGDDELSGDEFVNILSGGAGNDRIKGDLALDILNGGVGVDILDYSDQTEKVVVTLNGAIVTRTRINNADADDVSNFETVFGGSADDALTGDSLANTFRGGLGNDVLDGGTGFDTVDYSDKTISVALTLNGVTPATATIGAEQDSVKKIENIIGGSASDTLTGDAAANNLRGGGGKDSLDGGGGIDTADYSDQGGGLVIVLDGANPSVITLRGLADDTIRNFENVIGGTASDSITGDDLANRLFGGGGGDVLKGGLGADILDGGDGVDVADYTDKTVSVSVVLKGAADASVFVNGVQEDSVRNIESMRGGSGNDTLTGDALDNTFTGNLGNDLLRGGGGRDTLDGSTGSDTADYRDKNDAVRVTLAGSTLADVFVNDVAEDGLRNIENVIGGAGNDTLTGDTLANVLAGATGNDMLTGNAGADAFRFDVSLNASSNVDTIADFDFTADTIQLDNAIFTALSDGVLPQVAFHAAPGATSAQDISDRIIYDLTTGSLYYDPDGNLVGGIAAIKFAVLARAPTLSELDILVI